MNERAPSAVDAAAFQPPDHAPVTSGRIGVLIVNLGTPDGTTYWPMRRYLKEFLSDRRVIDVNRLVWWPVLNGIILTVRPSRSGKAYASIWNTELNESPLRTFTRSQSDKLGAALTSSDNRIVVDWAMRYGTPSVAAGIAALQAKGCDRILLFPLYPQYSAATNATVCDVAFDHLKTLRRQPAIRVVPPYYDDPLYIDALAGSVREHVDGLGHEPDVVLASFHGLPKRYVELGDPYYTHCAETVRRLRQALGWGEDRLKMTFQSRFGSEEWLQPYTDDTLKALAASGVKRVAAIMPGFVTDCVETLEEIAEGSREAFLHAGGEAFSAIPCLNDSPAGMAVLESVVRRELSGWV